MSTAQVPVTARRRTGLTVQIAWEVGLVALAMTTAGIVLGFTEAPFDTFLLGQIAALGFLAAGFALSLRTATPNLAVGAFAVVAGVTYARLINEGWSAAAAGLLAVAAVLAAGLALGALTGVSSAPGWAMSLVGLAAAQAAMLAFVGDQGAIRTGGTPDAPMGVIWVVAFAVVSVGEGVMFLVPAVRRFLGANRAGGDPAEWRPARIVGAVVGLGGSSLLAGIGGIALVEFTRLAQPSLDGSRLLLAIGAALLGGVSVFGRRGGVLGTVIATFILTLTTIALTVTNAGRWTFLAASGLAILIGIGFSRLLEGLAGPPD